jgi:beta-galactosidase
MKIFLISILICLISNFIFAQSIKRFEQDLSKNDWELSLDKNAKWLNDKLFLPPVNIENLPVNIPTGGWEAQDGFDSKIVNLPATVEEYFWGKNGNSFGLAGNYLGVSWFTTKFSIPENLKGKRISLHFESVRFRAEIFINKKLAGYDLVNSTPFEVDISKYIEFGKTNGLAVRITDPNGNFDWRDSKNFMWGDYRTIPTHGFGGITGKVTLTATDQVFIDDIFVMNKPKWNEVDVQLSLNNNTSVDVDGTINIQITEYKSDKVVYSKDYPIQKLTSNNNTNTFSIKVDGIKPWSVNNPNLYVLKAMWKGKDGSVDNKNQRFGFRWFEVRYVNGDKQFYLNDKRIVLRTAISWGFWPINGIAPTDEFAKKQIEDAKKIGLNMLNFHRTIGSTNVLDYADELGLLYFEEPGGYQFPRELFTPSNSVELMQRDFYVPCRREKFFRMVNRDRNHPSIVIYNLHNERGSEPALQDSTDMLDAHKLDPTRIIVYNSSNGQIKQGRDPRFKLHLLPYDFKFYDYGWFDQHHAGGPGVYHNNIYRNPKDYLRYTDKKDEIIYWGEEGAIGTPPRLQLIREDILKRGKNIGWESDTYLKWYDAYDSFLKNSGFNKVFKDVDAFTTSMGNVAYYYQGRVIENIRINNITDGYAVNGWESMILENHSGIVDNYRNPKGDINLIAKYNQPVFVSVKINEKVTSVGNSAKADFFIVNEVDLKGDYNLVVKATDAKGELFSKNIPVKISGGSVYGELLSEGMEIKLRNPGFTTVTAEIKSNNKTVAKGDDNIFAVELNTAGIDMNGMVADTNGVIKNYLSSVGINSLKQFTSGKPTGKFMLVGEFNPPPERILVTDILEWVNEGNTLIVINNTTKWAEYLASKEVIDYRGSQVLGTTWYGGNYFVKNSELFNSLPQSCVFNWEYQCFAAYNKNRIGLRLFNGETIVGCVSDHKKEVYSALSIIPHGKGKIILCALDIFSCIKDIRPANTGNDIEGQNAAMKDLNSSKQNAANIVGQRLLLNLLKYASK